VIRQATEADLPILRDIERAAGKCFADIGMAAVAEDEPPSLAVLLAFQQAGTAWVYVDDDDVPVAYLIADLVDGSAHVEQVSVHPNHAGNRIGNALVERLADWARERGVTSMTLTTFTSVVWNGPYYERCGFRLLSDDELTPGLRAIRAAEAERGLDEWPRGAMRRELQP
jgi:GNAT superfamily N-acetyltransferase